MEWTWTMNHRNMNSPLTPWQATLTEFRLRIDQLEDEYRAKRLQGLFFFHAVSTVAVVCGRFSVVCPIFPKLNDGADS